MKSLSTKKILCAAALLCFFPGRLRSQGLDPSIIANPSADSWPSYHGDYSGRRHSRLTQITPQNVASLALAWAFQTNQDALIKSSPLLVDGVLYFTVPDNVWAVDARTGHQIWHYTYKPNAGMHLGHRGVAMYKQWLYFSTPDAHLISLEAKNGKVRWDVVVGDIKKGYWTTMAPLVVRDHVILGVGGDLDNIGAYLRSIDPQTGKTQWQWNTTPPAGTPNATTGGTIWLTGTYDPDLNMLYTGTGNPTPVLNGKTRPGDNLYTCSIAALNPDTGKLVWAFQPSPHDTHDWDAIEVPVMVDADFHGEPRKLLMQASRNGYFFVLDRTNGKNLLTKSFSTVNWASGIDKDGRPTPAAAKEPARDGRLVAPNESGATNFRSPSFDPRTGLLVVSAQDGYGIYFFKPEHGAFGWAGADYTLYGRSAIRAIDYKTGAIKWNHDIGDGAGTAGVLTTESGLTFTGDIAGNLIALRTADGTTLWHAATGRVGNSPITFEFDGRQYLVVGAGSAVFAWSLPQP